MRDMYDLIGRYLRDQKRLNEIEEAMSALAAEKRETFERMCDAVHLFKCVVGCDTPVVWDGGEHHFKPLVITAKREIGSFVIQSGVRSIDLMDYKAHEADTPAIAADAVSDSPERLEVVA